MNAKCREHLESLISSCSSEALAVGDCLKTIAENGGEQAQVSYLVDCAENIRDAAQDFINTFKSKEAQVDEEEKADG